MMISSLGQGVSGCERMQCGVGCGRGKGVGKNRGSGVQNPHWTFFVL